MAECPVCHADLGIEARRGEIDGFSYRTKGRWYQPEEQEDALLWACPGCKSLLWKTGSGPALLATLALIPELIVLAILRHHGSLGVEWSSTTRWMFYAGGILVALIWGWCINRIRFPLKPVPFMSTSRQRVP